MDLLLDILDDIEANLKTIHKHGTRADSIVKSMLQHSRGGDGKMEATLLNPIIKEYVNLAFHGMRAGKEPINVDIDLQLDENVGEVPLIAEDFSRVILNLVNNAFDAMREKTLQGFGTLGGLEDYQPKLTVRTHRNENTVTIQIEDNGPGIPDGMKDKILQPFFTTKKGTQGTGLGLSITNDIIKAHGGIIETNSNENGTMMAIVLNIRS
jgi:signal transduction histidine kinase